MSEPIKEAVVVGGSLAGLMSAIVLRNIGYKVHVLERSGVEALKSQAAGIRAGPEVHAFINRYVSNVPQYAITLDTVEIMDKEGQVTSKFPSKEPMRLTTWLALYAMFKGALLDSNSSKPPATYQTRQLVEDVKFDDRKPTVIFSNLGEGNRSIMQADLIIAADGANSVVRKMLSSDILPKYAGYVTWRGRVPEGSVTTETREALQNRVIVLRVEGGYLVSYYVYADTPENNTRSCEFVWIWYDTIPEESPELIETMTDVHGRVHSATVPRGKMQPTVWSKKVEQSKSKVNQYFAELLQKTEEPFVSAIRDFPGKQSVFHNGKVLLVGDALALCRPHSGASTSQAAQQILDLADTLGGATPLDEWEKTSLANLKKAQAVSIAMGVFFFTAKAPTVIRYVDKGGDQ